MVNNGSSPSLGKLSIETYVDHLLADTSRLAEVLNIADRDTPVETCPGWSLPRLAIHLGVIHRWANACARDGAAPADVDAFEPEASTDLGDWLIAGATTLASTLRSLEVGAPTWHPFGVAKVAEVWPRRQAHETALHRWDAEHAAGLAGVLDAELASDGIDEYFEVFLERAVARHHSEPPSGSLHLHCTDVPGEWLVSFGESGLELVRAHQKGDAALRGPAAAILLALWGRTSHRDAELAPVGDEAVLDAWMAIGGI